MADDRRSRPWWQVCIERLPSPRDTVTSLIGLVVVVYVGVVLWEPLTGGAADGVSRAQAIMALLGPRGSTVRRAEKRRRTRRSRKHRD